MYVELQTALKNEATLKDSLEFLKLLSKSPDDELLHNEILEILKEEFGEKEGEEIYNEMAELINEDSKSFSKHLDEFVEDKAKESMLCPECLGDTYYISEVVVCENCGCII